ncbi:peroxisome proliferator-activated receptor gamma coactivator-related protein 1 isoform X2 [Antennarius striatus]|uniref:peroxisome proliferator-activated receptor gamma coactivator-related protein 1 isoform X2 n=1 Tax=Antennarius striatus TaxID=241820 RepID=UPI0035B3F1DC
MAVRWAAGDDTLTECNMQCFYMDTPDESTVLSPKETLDALQSSLDPSIFSFFEDIPTIEPKGIDEESEATLLSALTEILDNVDDENLSPFDTLPDSELLSGHKGSEHSPLKRLLCLSRSPPEKDTLCRPSSKGKSLPRMQAYSLQRSDGEEEDGFLTLSPMKQDSSDNNLLDWEGLALPLPITFEPEGEGELSLCLGDLVRQMHPYCMRVSVENQEEEHLLPEGGILLEVVDQGENGETILAIPGVDLPVCLPHEEHETDTVEKFVHEDDVTSDSSEHIVVDDEVVTVSEAPVKNEMIIKRPKEEIKEKSPSRRKKKKKCKELCQSVPVEGRVLRSGKVRRAIEESPKISHKRSSNKKKSLPKVPVVSTPSSLSNPNEANPCQSEKEISTTTLLPKTNVEVPTSLSVRQEGDLLNASNDESNPTYLPPAVRSQEPDEMRKQPTLASENLKDSSAAHSAVPPPGSFESQAAPSAPSPGTPPVIVAPTDSEPKAKSLSLAEYRRLRQQKKPILVENQGKINTSKWPSLPELPKELPPIPCLPGPSPRDPRRPNSQAVKNEVDLIKPAWQPRGPCAPPTPEALLVPPAYMASSSSRASAASLVPKPQPVPGPAKSPVSEQPSSPTSNREISTDNSPQSQPGSFKTVEFTQTCLETTTAAIKPTTAPKKITVVFPKVSEVHAPTSIDKPINCDCKSTKITANGSKEANSTQPTTFHCLKAESVVLEAKRKLTTAVKPQMTKSPMQDLVEAFTSEIGIEAADLTSLLEQFEETQALTPPGTPPHQMWKPLAPVALLRKSKASEASKSSPAKVIQIEARPLPTARSRSRPTSSSVAPEVACMDHDYCLPNKATGEPGKLWNVKSKSSITIKAIKTTPTTTQPPPAPLVSSVQSTNAVVKTKRPESSLSDEVKNSSVMETPDASPSWQGQEVTPKELSPKKGPSGRTYRQQGASRNNSPSSSPKESTRSPSRGRSHRSPSSMSSSSESDSCSSRSRSRSRSRSPSKKRYRPRHSRSSRSSSRSSSGSRSPPRRRRRYSYSRSRSGSWSRSRSRSRSPERQSRSSRSRRLYRPSFRPNYHHNAKKNMEKMKKCKEKAIEERRVVYVGGIRGTMTHNELRERFSLFGDIEDCTLHFRDHGDNYGFVTYYHIEDAFEAIKNGEKLRRSDELSFDVCFGGRRQFCRTSYADLDSILEYDPLPTKGKFHALDFDTLLKQAQQKLKR